MSGEFAGTLRERVVIEAMADVRDAAGMREVGWTVVCRCRASIAPDGVGPQNEAQALSAMARYRVTIRKRPGLGLDQRISWGGRKLMVRQIVEDPRSKDRIVLRCEEVRG